MPREDQKVVRSSIEAERIWSLYVDENIDENFHPISPPSLPPLPPLTTNSGDRKPSTHLLPYQRQVRPIIPHQAPLQSSREVERKVYRTALSEIDANSDRDKIRHLETELKRLKQERALLLRANVVMAKCMEKMTL